jgi:hypothetical protein
MGELHLADCQRLIICNLHEAQPVFFYVSQNRLRYTMHVCKK